MRCIFRNCMFSSSDLNLDKHVVALSMVRLQIITGGYRTKHGQATRTDLVEEFTHIKHVQAGKTNS